MGKISGGEEERPREVGGTRTKPQVQSAARSGAELRWPLVRVALCLPQPPPPSRRLDKLLPRCDRVFSAVPARWPPRRIVKHG